MIEFSMYSIGNGRFLREIFNAVAMLTGTGDFTKVVMIGMLFAVLVICVQAILRGGREISWQNILIGWILYAMFFAIPSRVVVEDVYTNDVYTVDNVPLGASAAGSMISKIGYGMTVLFETGFGTADRVTELPYLSSVKYLLLAERGASSALTLDQLSTQTGIDIRATLGSYIKNCTIPALRLQQGTRTSAGGMNVQDLLKLGSNDSVKGSAVYWWNDKRGTHQEQTCKEAYDTISKSILPKLDNDNVSSVINNQMQELSGNQNYEMNVNTAFTMLDLATQNQQDYMLAAIVSPIFDNAYKRFYTKNEVMADLMIAQAIQQRNIQWTAEQSIWSSVVMPLMTFFEGFVFAITPFCALLLCMGMFGLGLIGKYLQTLFWINLWMPIMAICNLYISMSVTSQLESVDLGTINGIEKVAEVLPNQIATGGMLMTATPLLALMVVTGSTYAFTTLASRLNGGDHIDEKMLAPDTAKVGTVFEQQVFEGANRGAGHLTTGKQETFETINIGEAANATVSSTEQRSKAAMSSFTKSFNENSQLGQQVLHSQSYTDSVNKTVQDTLSSMSDAGRSAVAQSLRSGQLAGMVKAHGGFEIGPGVSKLVSRFLSSSSPVAGSAAAGAAAQQTQTNLSKIGSIGVGADISLAGSNAAGYSNSDVVNFAKTLAQGQNVAAAQSVASMDTNQLSNSTGQSQATSLQQSASNALAANKAYAEAKSYSRSLGGTYAIKSNVFAKQVQDTIAQGGSRGLEAQRAIAEGMSLVNRNDVMRGAQFYMSAAGGYMNKDQAIVTSLLENLNDVSDPNKSASMLRIASAIEKNGGSVGNYAENASIPNPAGLGSVPNTTFDGSSGPANKATQKVDPTLPNYDLSQTFTDNKELVEKNANTVAVIAQKATNNQTPVVQQEKKSPEPVQTPLQSNQQNWGAPTD